MADDASDAGDGREVAIDLDEQGADLETAMREAVAAVEETEEDARRETEAEEVAQLRQEIADLRDRSMRTLADFDNFRKRSERERQELRRYAVLEPLRELLTVADSLALALSAQGSAEDLKRGVDLTLRQLQELMRRFGVTEIPAVGQPFDPALHEAVSREESAEVKAPTVVAELRRGYRIHDRLLRPAMVKVAVPPETAAAAAAGGEKGAAD
jgi:molecular chaperone GrpE